MVYLTGGPGQGSHWGQSALESKTHNLLLVNQRGISLSKPERLDDFLNPNFYSSEFIAKDLEVLRKSLKVSKWSLYGVSYGTIPATIYASLFPESTRSLILEGTGFSASQLSSFDIKKKIISEAILAQSTAVQKSIFQISTFAGINPSWLFQWARDTLLMNEGRQSLTTQLAALNDSTELQKFIQHLTAQYTPQTGLPPNDLFGLNEIPFYMISCQELGLNLPTTKTELQFQDGQIVEVRNPNTDQICKTLKATSQKNYLASDYPVKVPVTYFQGQNDSATEFPGAFQHFQTVPLGQKQMLLMSEGGHNPNLQILLSDSPEEQMILEKALIGELVPQDLLAKMNETEGPLQWQLLKQ